MDLAFFGKTVPLAGQRRETLPKSTITRLIRPSYERLSDGRYLVTHWMHGRCGPMQTGGITVCVMNEYGFLVVVEDRGRAWW